MRRVRPALRALAVVSLVLVALTGCSTEEALYFGWPEGITEEATQMRLLWTGSTLTALAVGVIVWGLIFWCCIAYRRRSGALPKQTAYNLPVEIILTVIPFIIIAGLFYYTIVVQTEVESQDAQSDVLVEVTGFQWNWEFQYPEETMDDTDEPISTVGDNTASAVLVLPVDQTIRFELNSEDVIHSFWVPEFLFKLDVIPGKNLGYDNDFEVTIEEEGSYVGRCAEFCGIYHSAMNFELRAVSQDVYADYIDARASGLSNAEALESVGQPGLAQTTEPFDTDRTRRSASD